MRYFCLGLLAFFFVICDSSAQESSIYQEANRHYRNAQDLFAKAVYPAAREEYQKALDIYEPINEPIYQRQVAESRLRIAQIAVYTGRPESERLMMDIVRELEPDPYATRAVTELGHYFFEQGDYPKALEYYNRIDPSELDEELRAELQFKKGYAHFVNKEFKPALSNLSGVINVKNDYYHASNYYYGMASYFTENYDQAVRGLRVAQDNKRYASQVPYYIAQIQFSKGNYQEVIDYAEPVLASGELRQEKELRLLLGQSYFEQGRYAEAIPELQYYEQRSSKMRSEDFYQLGYALYLEKKYAEAIPHFQQLTKLDSEIGQNAAYYLGDCFLRTGEKNSARSAFRRVSQLDYDKEMKEEAFFNYAKLSAQLGYDREAVNSLTQIKPNSPYYAEAQDILSDLLTRTGDYAGSLEIMKDMDMSSPKIQEVYQKNSFYRAIQLYQQGELADSYQYLDQALQFTSDPDIHAQTLFWQGEIKHRQQAYEESTALLARYMALPKKPYRPAASAPYMASYIAGHNFFKVKEYQKASSHFEKAISGIRSDYDLKNSAIQTKVLSDAWIKLGDCHFDRNDYDAAQTAYQSAIEINTTGVAYAKLQSAIILGLQDQKFDKIILLEEIVDKYPQTGFADDALYELGLTYQDLSKPDQAKEAFSGLINRYADKSPLIVPSLLQMGLLSYNQGAVDEALGYYQRVFDYNPTANEAEGALAAIKEIYIEDKGDSEGYAAFLRSIPGYDLSEMEEDELAYRAAEVKYENADYEGAIKGYTDYLMRYPQGLYKLSAHFRRGDSYTFVKKYSEALEDFQKVADLGPSPFYAKSVRNAALISYNYQENFAEALKYYQKWEEAAENDEDRFEAQLGALRSAYRLDQKDETLRLAALVADNPNATPAQRLTALFFQAKVSMDRQDYPTALSAFTEVAMSEPSSQTAESRFRIAQIYYLQGDLAKAESAIQDANQNNSAFPYWIAKGLILLSDIYSDRGQYTDARVALEAVIENFKDDEQLLAEANEKLKEVNQKEEANSRLDDDDEGQMPLQDGSQN